MLLQSANEFGLQLPNAALGLATQQAQMNADFYTERTELNKTGEKTKEDYMKNVEEDMSDEV